MQPKNFLRLHQEINNEFSFFSDILAGPVSSTDNAADAHEKGGEVSEFPVIPTAETIIYPRLAAPLFITRELSRRALEAAQDEDAPLLVIGQKDQSIEYPTSADLYSIGTAISIGRVLRLPDATLSLLCHGEHRVEIIEVLQERPYLRVRGRVLADAPDVPENIDVLKRAVLAMYEKVLLLNPNIPEEAMVAAVNLEEPGWLADLIASTLSISLGKRQQLLEILDPVQRLQRLSTILAEELGVLELENQIHEQVQRQIDDSQREYFLREQIRAIQEELGEGDEFQHDMREIDGRIHESAMPSVVRDKAEKELRRLRLMPAMAPETGVVRTYIEWLLDLPWNHPSVDNTDIATAERVLDTYHYGLDKAKERILEHIAVRKLAADKMRTPILCFAGPPGTGKTSMGKSVAEALGRTFVRISLGGVRDEAEIRGHRRTYIGAMPGRIIQTMRNADVVNPVFMLDEVDKMGYDFRGDPSSALLEVLDPEQNHAFSDHYLDVPYDLSKVFFITTANNPYDIPSALLDRMEVIEFPGYADFEKTLIARQFLIPRLLREHGLEGAGLNFSDEAISEIIQNYTYEAGVRNLERGLATICRKVARRVAEDKKSPKRINPTNIHRFLGPQRFIQSKIEDDDLVGVSTSLAWTPAGGDITQIEVILMPGKGGLTMTGQLGEVMQESAQAALSYARSHADVLGFGDFDFDKVDIHIHLPEGAIPKDGPSAGITLATALISALTKRPVRRDVGMTGEITLRGRVLAIGGLKEKLLAAHRVGLTTIVIPQRNENDLSDVPRHIRRHLDIKLVSHIEQVLAIALLDPLPSGNKENPASPPE